MNPALKIGLISWVGEAARIMCGGAIVAVYFGAFLMAGGVPWVAMVAISTALGTKPWGDSNPPMACVILVLALWCAAAMAMAGAIPLFGQRKACKARGGKRERRAVGGARKARAWGRLCARRWLALHEKAHGAPRGAIGGWERTGRQAALACAALVFCGPLATIGLCFVVCQMAAKACAAASKGLGQRIGRAQEKLGQDALLSRAAALASGLASSLSWLGGSALILAHQCVASVAAVALMAALALWAFLEVASMASMGAEWRTRAPEMLVPEIFFATCAAAFAVFSAASLLREKRAGGAPAAGLLPGALSWAPQPWRAAAEAGMAGWRAISRQKEIWWDGDNVGELRWSKRRIILLALEPVDLALFAGAMACVLAWAATALAGWALARAARAAKAVANGEAWALARSGAMRAKALGSEARRWPGRMREALIADGMSTEAFAEAESLALAKEARSSSVEIRKAKRL